MNKYTNPFQAIKEAMEILKSHGADPLCNIPEDQVDWRNRILSVTTQKLYTSGEHHSILIHMSEPGFTEVARLTNSIDKVVRAPFTEEYEEFSFIVSPGLKIFRLAQIQEVPK